ncbi:MAG TPA: ABC transporter substrate-binding protein [Thermoplasmata archaeon]|nr:ABC transporter substrate-binding protein [Thermoplasmata archaeon]
MVFVLILMSLNDPPVPVAAPRRASLAVVAVLLVVVAGVAVAATAAYYSTRPATVAGPPGSLHLTDDLGRSVTVPYDPARIVVLGPSIMDIVYRLGLRSHVVGVDCYAAADGGLAEDYSPDQIQLWQLSSSMCVQIGPEFAPSTLAALDPQLVLAATIVSIPEVLQITDNLGIPVVMLQPPTLSGILVDDSLVGEIFGAGAVANSLNAELAGALYNATNFTSNQFTLPTVLITYSVDPSGYWSFGPGTFGTSLIEVAGGASISASATTPYPELSPSQVLTDDPQLIVYGVGFGLNESTYAAGPDWSSFGAVINGNLTGLDSNWLTEPDPTMILDGLPALQAAFYPGTG